MYQLVKTSDFSPTLSAVAVTADTPGTRSRILAEAIDAFGTRGYDAVSLDDLAELLGVRKQTILYHFGSKAELFEATIDSAIGDLGVTLIEAGTGQTAGRRSSQWCMRSSALRFANPSALASCEKSCD